MKSYDVDVVIVGAGVAGLCCARHLLDSGISFTVLEADERIGGRLKTDEMNGFLLNHGFQVLQSAYPEARRMLDYKRLDLKAFAAGAMVWVEGRFHRISDPLRRPQDLWSSLTAPIGSFSDRLRMIQMVVGARRRSVSQLFQAPDMTTLAYLRSEGFSEKMIQRFFIPFFGGVCLDPAIGASSRVFRYVLRMFAEGDVALPARGMGAIAAQLAEGIPDGRIRTAAGVETIRTNQVTLQSGEKVSCRWVVIATDGPETARLLDRPTAIASRSEACVYFAAEKSPIDGSYLILNGEGDSVVNSVTIPSFVAGTYAPAGQVLISAVLIGDGISDGGEVASTARQELTRWFGPDVRNWRHLKTYQIAHALPTQPPPMPDPTVPAKPAGRGVAVCGEYGLVPGIQWGMLSGRHAAETIRADIAAP
jgi:phytoene dehydrogenase-like protein